MDEWLSPWMILINEHRLTALNSPLNEVGQGLLKQHLQTGFETLRLLLYRPFLQNILMQLTTTSTKDKEGIPVNIPSRAQKAINISVNLVSMSRTRQIIDWFSLKQVIIAVLLVLVYSRVLGDDNLSPEETLETMNGATEILARAASRSESAKRALQLLSEIRVGFQFGEGKDK